AIQDAVYTYNVQATDPDVGDVLTLTATQKPSWLTFTDNGSGTATLTGTPTNADLGGNPLTLRVVDNSGAAINQVFTINVDNQNDPPSFTSTPVQSVNEDAVYTYNITTTDPDAGDTRTIIALSLPGWLGLSDNGDGTAVLTGTPLNQHVGNLNLVIEVQDGLGVKATQSFTVTILNTNDVPAFSTSPVTGAIQDVVYTYSVQAIDPDIGDILTLTATQKPNWLTFTDNGSGTATLTGTPTNADLGSNSVTLRVVDNSGAAINQVFTINVDNQNDPPSFTSTPVQSVNEDALYAYNITTTDPDVGDTRSITALSLPEWLSLTDNGDGNAVLTGTPLNQHVGSLNLVLEVEDGVGVKVTQSFTVTIFNTNDVPAFSTSPVLTVQQGNLYEYQVATSDPDLGDSRVLTTGALPSWLDFTDNGDGTGLLFGNPANEDLGEYAIILTVEDASGAAVDQVFEISVTNLNDPPIFTSTPITLIDEDALYEYNITATDPDTGDVLSITALSKPAWLTLVDNADGTGLLSGTPLNSNVGANEVVLNITDDNGANSNQTFTIQVINTNDAPSIISSPFLTAQQDLLYTYNIQIQDPDIGDTFVFEGQGIPAWLTLTDNGNGTAKLWGTPIELDQGTYNIEVKVIDNAGAEDVQSFELLVNNENDPPVFESAPIISVNEDENYSYQITTSDPDVGDILNIVIIDKPSWLTFVDNDDNTAQLSGVPTNNDVGVHQIKLRVTDVALQTTEQNFELTVVNTNDKPIFTSTPVTNLTEDLQYEYQITTTDVDLGEILTLGVQSLPDWLTLVDNGDGTALLSGTPLNEDVGSHLITLTVTDGHSSIVLQQFDLTVSNTNDAPVITSEPVLSVLEDDLYEYVIIVNDPDVGDDYTVSSTSLPSWLALSADDSGNALLSGTPLNEHVGVVEINLKVEDLAGAIDEQIFNLEVVNTNDNPIFTSEPVAKVGIEEVFLYDVTVVDPDLNDRVTIVANKIPPYLTFVDNGNGTARVQGTVPQNAAENKDIILEATDLNGGKELQEFSLDVNNPPTLNNFEVSTDEDVDYQFSLVDFESNFNDDPGDELSFIRVMSLPSNGRLFFNGEAIDLSSDISANQITALVYRPNLNYFGDDNFEWKGSDGTSISSQTAEVSIAIEPINDAPQLITGRQGDVLDALEYSPGDPGLNILRGGEVTVRDNDDGDLIEGAQVSISTNFNSGDQLTLELEAQDIFQSTYNAQNGILTITGSASATAYSDVLEKVKFASSVSSSIELLDKQLQIVVVDEEDESNIVSRVIKITEVFPELDIVNAFTPNGDGVNDVWDILNLQFYSDISINVYDADGSKVFSCSDQNCQWDGTNKGRELPFGPYFYAIDLNDGKRKYTGTVTILK
ncbi:MAG: putative Ig domain-containing protein, partial [Fulvivirga sp.]|uniref:putative Ig domain-containing protein n=2 Tax=Fulvivirga sp. TaxID=1931237 RepID=UPI0032EC7884